MKLGEIQKFEGLLGWVKNSDTSFSKQISEDLTVFVTKRDKRKDLIFSVVEDKSYEANLSYDAKFDWIIKITDLLIEGNKKTK